MVKTPRSGTLVADSKWLVPRHRPRVRVDAYTSVGDAR